MDSPWKETLQLFFQEFLAFFFPEAHGEIDWTKPPEFLDKELQKIVRDSKIGKRIADQLVKVWRKNGIETWVLVHVEIQGKREPEFSRRMFVYNYRLFDRYSKDVASFAILCDNDRSWRPKEFSYELWGCKVGMEFKTVKLFDFVGREKELELSLNPFSIIVAVHLAN